MAASEGASGAEIPTTPQSGTITAQAAGSMGSGRTNWAMVIGGVIVAELFVIIVGIGLLLRRKRSDDTPRKKTRTG